MDMDMNILSAIVMSQISLNRFVQISFFFLCMFLANQRFIFLIFTSVAPHRGQPAAKCHPRWQPTRRLAVSCGLGRHRIRTRDCRTTVWHATIELPRLPIELPGLPNWATTPPYWATMPPYWATTPPLYRFLLPMLKYLQNLPIWTLTFWHQTVFTFGLLTFKRYISCKSSCT